MVVALFLIILQLFETVAKALACGYVCSVYTNLFAKTGDIYIYGSVSNYRFVLPNLLKNLCTTEKVAAVLQEQLHNLELLFGQLCQLISNMKTLLFVVQC